MTLYPQARDYIAGYRHDPDIDIDADRARSRAEAAAAPREDVLAVEDFTAGTVPCRLYVPANARNGAIVHVHGGGFVFHDIDVHDATTRRLANRSRMAVISVDYRRPPEHRFPAAVLDVDEVVEFLPAYAAARELTGPVFIHGDSAGGNLALVAALRNPGTFAAVALTYPFLDPTASFASYDTVPDGFDRSEAGWYWQQYAATVDDLTNPDLAPLLSDRLYTLPPTLITTAEHDPLRDEGEFLALKLAELGVTVTATRYLGQVHAFMRHHGVFDAADPLQRQIAGFFAAYADEASASPR